MKKCHRFSPRGDKGFTLIELLVVIAIIGMLSSIVLASLNSARAKARNAGRSQAIEQLRNAFALVQTGGTLPTSNSGGTQWTCVSASCPWGYNTHEADAALAPYIRLSNDPTGGKTYYGFLYIGPYPAAISPYVGTGGYYMQWSVERPLTSTSCAPGVVWYDEAGGYPNDIFCLVRLD